MRSPSSVPVVHAYPDLGPMIPAARERLPATEIVVIPDEAAFADSIGDVEVLFTFRPPTEHWARADSLRLLQMTGAGVDSVLPAVGLRDEVTICNAVGIHLPEMAEFVLGMVLSLHLGVPKLVDQQRAHDWTWVLHPALAGRRAVILGTGRIGAGCAELLRAVGLRVDGVSRSGAAVDGFDRVVTVERRMEVLDGADIIVVLVPLTPETVGLVGRDELAALAPGSQLVDVSRGGIVDHDALRWGLREGPLAAAALDVFDPEPLPADDPMWDEPNVLITPHVAALSSDYFDRLVDVLVENVERLRDGRPLLNVVDRDRGY
ncbi:MAG: D-2-hydroxyacid dehydrogenase [Actinomycetota bacterium]